MDFIDQLKQFSSRIEKMKDQLKTEEATKTALILPFFQLLGYDIFNPSEFVPEFVADTGIKKGEKVDYAVLLDDKPMILIEAKWCGEKLDNHDSQLFRYFVTTPSKFAILTNGIIYKVYTDLEEPNKMDEQPFLEFNLLDIKESVVPEIRKFEKGNFNLETIFNSASELKYSNQIKQLLQKQLNDPTDAFVNFILGEVYAGRKKTQNVVEKFREISRKSLNEFINELMNERIKSALQHKPEEQPKPEETPQEVSEDKTASRILTTVTELEGYFIVKNILRDIIPGNRITYKDTESYFGILLENNTWKWICRLYLGEVNKYIIIPDENKKGVKYNITQLDDIYNYKDQLVQVANRYL